MRIALIGLHFAEYSYRLANALAEDNDVLLLAERSNFVGEIGGENPPDVAPRLKLCFINHSRGAKSVIENARTIISQVRHFRPSVIHIQETVWDYLVFALPWLRAYPRVLTIHDPEPHSGEKVHKGFRKRFPIYLRLLRHSCTAAIAHGQFLCSEVERLYPRLQGRTYPVPHGPLGQVDSLANGEWTPGNLLFFGRIQAYKGLRNFIEAVEQLARSGRKVHGIIAGRGAELEGYRDRITTSGLFRLEEGFIPSDKVPALFHDAHVVVLPYTDGTQSGVAALAMGFGRPVVASRVGSIPELVLDGETGFLSNPSDTTDLVDKLARIIDDRELSLSMGKRGLSRCQHDLSWKNIASITKAAYKNVVSELPRS